jgi:hypothetical protein
MAGERTRMLRARHVHQTTPPLSRSREIYAALLRCCLPPRENRLGRGARPRFRQGLLPACPAITIRRAVLLQPYASPRQVPVGAGTRHAGLAARVECAANGCGQPAVALVQKQLAVCADHHWILESHLERLGVSLSNHVGGLFDLLDEAIRRAPSNSSNVLA